MEKYQPLQRVKRKAIKIPLWIWAVGALALMSYIPVGKGPNNEFVFNPTVTYTPSITPTVTFTPTSTATVTPTVIPTFTAFPTSTVEPNYLTIGVQYSYYDPKLGPPNCHPANWDGVTCANTTASGVGWIGNYGKAVAIPIEWDGRIPFGSVVRVLSPSEMVGDYTIIDLCGACIKPDYPGLIWFDFLDDRQRLNWSVDMVVQIIIK